MYKTIDLCAGIGGIRQGFCKTGEFVNVLSAEIDEFAAETYKLNFNGEDPLNDLTSIEFKNKAERVGCDVLLAGFPCQPFSSQGNKEGFDDPTKGTIFFHIKQIINKTRPKVIFLENVQNIVSHDGGRTIHVIIDSLEKKLNYKVVGISYNENGQFVIEHSKLVRNTKDFGLPQNRPRAFFIAFDRRLYEGLFDNIDDNLPTELYASLKKNPLLNRSLNQLLETNVDITSLKPISQRTPKLYDGAIKGVPARIHFREDSQEAIERIETLIDELKNEGITDVVILTCKSEFKSILKENSDNGTFKKKVFTTCRKFKGLEADAIILIDVDEDTFGSEAVQRFYVGASRARLRLEIVTTMTDENCEKVLREVVDYKKKIKNAKRELALAFNTMPIIE